MVTIHLNVPGAVLVTANIHNQISVAFVSAVTLVSGFTELGFKLQLLCSNLVVGS